MTAAFASFIVANAIAAMSVSALVKGLVSTHEKEKTLSNSLEKERRHLIEAKETLESEMNERRQFEEALKYEKKRLDSLISHNPLGIVTLDEEHNVVSCNKAFEQLFQFGAEEIRGKNLDEVIAGREHIEEARSYTEEDF